MTRRWVKQQHSTSTATMIPIIPPVDMVAAPFLHLFQFCLDQRDIFIRADTVQLCDDRNAVGLADVLGGEIEGLCPEYSVCFFVVIFAVLAADVSGFYFIHQFHLSVLFIIQLYQTPAVAAVP